MNAARRSRPRGRSGAVRRRGAARPSPSISAASGRRSGCDAARSPSSPRIMRGAASNWSSAAGAGISRPRPISRTCCAASARSRASSVARGDRDAGDHRLSRAGQPRRDRGDPRRADLQGHARRADGGGLGAPAGRREVPGRPLIYATTAEFLQHFGLASRRDLPGIDDLRAAGLLDPVDRFRGCDREQAWKMTARKLRAFWIQGRCSPCTRR